MIPLWFVFRNLARNWQALVTYEIKIDFGNVVPATLILVIAFGLLPLTVQRSLASLGTNLSFRAAYWAYFIPQLSKYLPGGVWIFPGRALVLQRQRVEIAASSAAMLAELAILVLSGTLMLIPYGLHVGTAEVLGKWWWILLAGVVMFAIVNPLVLNPLFGWILGRIGRSDVIVDFNMGSLSIMLLVDCAFWFVVGVGFFFLVSSVYSVPVAYWLPLGGAFSVSWVVGFLAFITPAGLGVREGVLTLLLSPLLPIPLPALVAVVSRLWWTIAELASVAIAVLIGGRVSEGESQSGRNREESKN